MLLLVRTPVLDRVKVKMHEEALEEELVCARQESVRPVAVPASRDLTTEDLYGKYLEKMVEAGERVCT